MDSECGDPRVYYTARGLERWEVEVRHNGLAKYQVIRADDPDVLTQKVRAKLRQWDLMWERKLEADKQRDQREARAVEVESKKSLAAERTSEARATLAELSQILGGALDIDSAVTPPKDTCGYPKPRPLKPPLPHKPQPPEQPLESGFGPVLRIFDRLFPSRRRTKESKALLDLQRHIEGYNRQVREYNARIITLQERYTDAVLKWKRERAAYFERAPRAIVNCCDFVLSNSTYPDYFPQSFELDYNPDNRVLIVEYELPNVDSMPTVSEVRYVQARDEFEEKNIPPAEKKRIYDSLLYQIALRTTHELYRADIVGAIESIVFNGYVRAVDKATGQGIHPCLLSLQTRKEECLQVNLNAIGPKACFRKLKGVSGSSLHSMTRVAPVLWIDRSDKRFVEGRAVVDGVAVGDNLAAMHWADFEHLVRELFEKEYARDGGEVKVTRASRDGGVDAVIFDPDPLRGGKTVVRAKRYTNTVGVSAVRDLYGTGMNEGANKGILVCTSDYGPDAYEFAKGKPLLLLNGGQLLNLLEKHGHQARIDLKEAKRLLKELESS